VLALAAGGEDVAGFILGDNQRKGSDEVANNLPIEIDWAIARRMAKENELAKLNATIENLKDYVVVLTQAVDELREQVADLRRNGLPLVRDDYAAAAQWKPGNRVRQMAADPCADDWNERLVVEPMGRNESPPPPADEPPTVDAQLDLTDDAEEPRLLF